MNDNREQLTQQIIDAGRFLYGRGWSPATSSNYSARLDEQRALLTVSGKHKGQLGFDDVLATDLAGNSLEPGKKPSAETLLHTQLYAWNPAIGAVLHTHSVNATVLSRLVAATAWCCRTTNCRRPSPGSPPTKARSRCRSSTTTRTSPAWPAACSPGWRRIRTARGI